MNKYLNPIKYIKFILQKIFCGFVPIIRLWENRYIKKYSSLPLKHQPVFIIGAPRTGSTILYQTVTNQLDVLYIDNLGCKFNKNIFFGFWLSNKLFKQKAHNCFKSNHGTTKGLHAPSECGVFWYRWLPRDRHFIDYDNINDEMVEQIKNEITAVINYFDRPLVFKNLNAGQRLRLLQKCFPDAKFIFVRRTPFYTAQSILKAKRKLHISDDKLWSIMPSNLQEIKKLEPYEQIVKQIFYIEKQISEDSKLFSEDRFLNINYDKLCISFNKVIRKCKAFIGAEYRHGIKTADIQISEKISLSKEEVISIDNEIKKLDWEFYND